MGSLRPAPETWQEQRGLGSRIRCCPVLFAKAVCYSHTPDTLLISISKLLCVGVKVSLFKSQKSQREHQRDKPNTSPCFLLSVVLTVSTESFHSWFTGNYFAIIQRRRMLLAVSSLLPLLEVLLVGIASPLLPVSKYSLQSHTQYLKNTSPSLHLSPA